MRSVIEVLCILSSKLFFYFLVLYRNNFKQCTINNFLFFFAITLFQREKEKDKRIKERQDLEKEKSFHYFVLFVSQIWIIQANTRIRFMFFWGGGVNDDYYWVKWNQRWNNSILDYWMKKSYQLWCCKYWRLVYKMKKRH